LFREDELRISVREDFVGVVIRAEFPCKCEICRRGYQKLQEMKKETKIPEKVHIVIKPLTVYDKLQHAWYSGSSNIFSTHGAFTIALNRLLGFVPRSNDPEERWKEVKRFMEGKAFKWTSVKPAEWVLEMLVKKYPEKEKMLNDIYKSLPQGLREAREIWIPVKVISKEELEQLGITDVNAIIEEAKEELEYEERGIDEDTIDEIANIV